MYLSICSGDKSEEVFSQWFENGGDRVRPMNIPGGGRGRCLVEGSGGSQVCADTDAEDDGEASESDENEYGGRADKQRLGTRVVRVSRPRATSPPPVLTFIKRAVGPAVGGQMGLLGRMFVEEKESGGARRVSWLDE